MSPGSTWAESRLSSRPPRSTLALMVTCERNFAIALLATCSWMKPSTVLPKTMARTTPASIHSAAASDTTGAKIRISTSGLFNWLANRPSALACRVVSSAFGPQRASRRSAWGYGRPLA